MIIVWSQYPISQRSSNITPLHLLIIIAERCRETRRLSPDIAGCFASVDRASSVPQAGMVTAAEVEQALKQRLEAKDVVRALIGRLIGDCDVIVVEPD